MELIRVKTEDVFPSEDNPRKDFRGIAALADSFALNPVHPGEPITPPLLVRDGQIYRIVDGERRYKAMLSIKTAEFDAIVCDGWDDVDVALTMLATDDKQALTELERSHGAQRALLLGVDPEKVERATRKKGMRRAKRGAEIAGAEAECMSLDHLMAIAEFEDDHERSERIANADEHIWERVAKKCRDEAKNERAMDKLRAKADELGITLLEHRPEDAKLSYEATCRTPEDLAAVHTDLGDGAACHVIATNQWDGARVIVYVPDADEDAEASAARELAESYANAANSALDSISDYLIVALMNGLYPVATMRRAVEQFMGDADDSWSRRGKATEAVDASGWDGPCQPGKATGLLGVWLLHDCLERASIGKALMEYMTGARDGSPEWAVRSARVFADITSSATNDGWEMTAACSEVVDELRAWIDKAEEENEEETEEEE